MTFRRIALLVLALASLGGSLGCAKFEEYQAKDKVKQRVFGMLDGVQKGGTGTSVDAQRAICLWYNGSVVIHDTGILGRASDLFLVWQKEGDIARNISGFTVDGAEEAGGGSYIVSGTIESHPFSVRVAPGEPMAWVRKPNR